MANRDAHLDVVKGFLVLVMVVYHAMNYFEFVDPSVYGYLRFVNGSFVFLSGFAILMLARPQQVAASPAEKWRGTLRGLRLLLLFTALNLLIGLAGMSSYRNAEFAVGNFVRDAYRVYVIGDSNAMAFRILAPIAYTVALSPLFVMAGRWKLPLFAGSLIAAALYPTFADSVAPTVFFLLIGLVGMTAGALGSQWVRRSAPTPWIPLALALAVAVALMDRLSGNVLAYCAGIAVVLKCIYDASQRAGDDGTVSKLVALLGRYSLLAYISQIGFLHGLRLALRASTLPPGIKLIVACAAAAAFVVALCLLVDHLRTRHARINAAYRFVFG